MHSSDFFKLLYFAVIQDVGKWFRIQDIVLTK